MKKTEEQIIEEVEKGIRLALIKKMNSYKRETSYMPFQDAILGKKNTALYSFGISISTWLGQNRKGGYEEIARILSTAAGSEVKVQYEIPFSISEKTEKKIYSLYTLIRKKKLEPDADKLAKKIKKFTKSKKGKHEELGKLSQNKKISTLPARTRSKFLKMVRDHSKYW